MGTKLFTATVLAAFAAEELMEIIYKRTQWYKRTLGGCERLSDVPYGLEIVNIGSGPGMHAISYERCGLRGFNFSTAPQNFKYGFRLLKRYKEHITPGAIVMIVVMSPLSFGRNADYSRPSYSDKYYGILPAEEIDGYSIWRRLVVAHPLARAIFMKLRNRLVHKAPSASIVSTEPAVVRIWKEEFGLHDLRDPLQAASHSDAFEEKVSILQEGLDFCVTQGWQPILVVPPIPSETRAFISDEFLDAFFYESVRRVLAANEGLRLLDYFDDDMPDGSYANEIFMSERGRRYFSARLFRDVERCFAEGIREGNVAPLHRSEGRPNTHGDV